MMLVRLEPVAPWSLDMHSINEPLRSSIIEVHILKVNAKHIIMSENVTCKFNSSKKLNTVLYNSPAYTPISPRIIFVPKVPDQYFWLIGRISAKQSGACGTSRAITGKVWKGLAQSPQSYESRVPNK